MRAQGNPDWQPAQPSEPAAKVRMPVFDGVTGLIEADPACLNRLMPHAKVQHAGLGYGLWVVQGLDPACL